MQRIIIGTAGHIDHGKTTLVKAMTGVDTDRLKEEKQRGISIELGFAPLDFPNGQRAGLVDVPGHERFIRQMLAGASGIDMVILVVAADEGVMPQTREHMDIIELLGIDRGVVAITKKDLVEEDWLMLVEEEVREYLEKTVLKGAPVIPVSALTGEGIPELVKTLQEMAEQIPGKPAAGKVRLPIDRVFTMTGFGTVVTGTLWSGEIKVGDTLEILPSLKQVRVRNLQVHGQKVEKALAGQRVAANLQGVEVEEIRRGYVLATPGFLQPSYRVDTVFRLLTSSPWRLKNWTRIRFHLGTDEALGRIVLLDRDELAPGEEAYAQIVMEKPVVAYQQDRFVARFYSPVTTIGGGKIIDPHPPKQKRFREDVLAMLAVKEEGSVLEIIAQELESNSDAVLSVTDIAREVGEDEQLISQNLAVLLEQGRIATVEVEGKRYHISCQRLEQLENRTRQLLADFHSRYPLRKGYSREELRTKLFKTYSSKIAGGLLGLLEQRGVIKTEGNYVALPEHRPSPSPAQENAVRLIMQEMNKQPFFPPGSNELLDLTGLEVEDFNEILSYLLEQGRLVKVAENTYFSAEAIEKGKALLEEYFRTNRELGLATARDLFNSSRKYTLPLMEYYDRIRFTKRVGDVRVRFR